MACGQRLRSQRPCCVSPGACSGRRSQPFPETRVLTASRTRFPWLPRMSQVYITMSPARSNLAPSVSLECLTSFARCTHRHQEGWFTDNTLGGVTETGLWRGGPWGPGSKYSPDPGTVPSAQGNDQLWSPRMKCAPRPGLKTRWSPSWARQAAEGFRSPRAGRLLVTGTSASLTREMESAPASTLWSRRGLRARRSTTV